MNERKIVKAFFGTFKYEGELISDTNGIYVIDDKIEGIVRLPILNTVLKEGKDDSS